MISALPTCVHAASYKQTKKQNILSMFELGVGWSAVSDVFWFTFRLNSDSVLKYKRTRMCGNMWFLFTD